MRKFLILVFALNSSFFSIAQTPRTYTSSELLHQVRKLNVLGSVLYIAAHPDDENTRLLGYLANEKQYRTGYLSLTRGDGGQNLIGNEQGIELGLIRTQELLAARNIDGAEQFFTRAYDFGFSKSPEEAMNIWGHDKVLSDVVWVIRTFRPDVVIARFPEDSRAGHGHHSASGILAREAFAAAADPKMFPEQLKNGVTVWKATRLLWNTFSFGNVSTLSEDQFKIDVGMYNPLLGKGYGEIASLSRSQHKSQGFGVAAQRGSSLEYFVTVKGDTPKKELLDGVNVTWNRVKHSNNSLVQKTIDSLIRNFSPVNPATSVPQLVRLYNEVSKVNDSYWKELKQKEIQSLIEYCSGLFLEATVGNPYAFEGDSLKIQLTLNNRAGVNVSAAKASVNGAIYSFGMVKPNNNITQGVSMLLNETSQSMQPYWLQHSMDAGSFAVMDQQLIGRAENEAPKVLFNLIIEGTSFVFEKPIRYKFTDPVKGELYQPYVVLPKNTPVESELRANVKLNLLNEKRDGGNKSLASTQHANENTSRLVLRNISYDHIPSINYFRIDSVLEVSLDLKIGGKKIGYIEGAGDKVVSALQQMGYDVTILSDKELDAVDLTIYNAIITGVRAYNVRPTLNNYYDKLMKYIEQGGNLIVQYNTSSQIGPIKAKIGPYPFTISRTRVTDENASVNVLKPKHPLLNYPNKITAKDFENWVQERSIYHAQGWDPNYETIFAMNDVGEKADEGSLIVAKYGKGNFVYTGLVFFRELPAGIPGAYRLLANILALPNN